MRRESVTTEFSRRRLSVPPIQHVPRFHDDDYERHCYCRIRVRSPVTSRTVVWTLRGLLPRDERAIEAPRAVALPSLHGLSRRASHEFEPIRAQGGVGRQTNLLARDAVVVLRHRRLRYLRRKKKRRRRRRRGIVMYAPSFASNMLDRSRRRKQEKYHHPRRHRRRSLRKIRTTTREEQLAYVAVRSSYESCLKECADKGTHHIWELEPYCQPRMMSPSSLLFVVPLRLEYLSGTFDLRAPRRRRRHRRLRLARRPNRRIRCRSKCKCAGRATLHHREQ